MKQSLHNKQKSLNLVHQQDEFRTLLLFASICLPTVSILFSNCVFALLGGVIGGYENAFKIAVLVSKIINIYIR